MTTYYRKEPCGHERRKGRCYRSVPNDSSPPVNYLEAMLDDCPGYTLVEAKEVAALIEAARELRTEGPSVGISRLAAALAALNPKEEA